MYTQASKAINASLLHQIARPKERALSCLYKCDRSAQLPLTTALPKKGTDLAKGTDSLVCAAAAGVLQLLPARVIRNELGSPQCGIQSALQ